MFTAQERVCNCNSGVTKGMELAGILLPSPGHSILFCPMSSWAVVHGSCVWIGCLQSLFLQHPYRVKRGPTWMRVCGEP